MSAFSEQLLAKISTALIGKVINFYIGAIPRTGRINSVTSYTPSDPDNGQYGAFVFASTDHPLHTTVLIYDDGTVYRETPDGDDIVGICFQNFNLPYCELHMGDAK